jgi:hypothetical protein
MFNSLYSSPMRHQAQPDRVCSLTAFVLLLRELLPTDTVPQHLLGLLHRKSEIVLRQSNKEWKATSGLNHKHKALKGDMAAVNEEGAEEDKEEGEGEGADVK